MQHSSKLVKPLFNNTATTFKFQLRTRQLLSWSLNSVRTWATSSACATIAASSRGIERCKAYKEQSDATVVRIIALPLTRSTRNTYSQSRSVSTTTNKRVSKGAKLPERTSDVLKSSPVVNPTSSASSNATTSPRPHLEPLTDSQSTHPEDAMDVPILLLRNSPYKLPPPLYKAKNEPDATDFRHLYYQFTQAASKQRTKDSFFSRLRREVNSGDLSKVANDPQSKTHDQVPRTQYAVHENRHSRHSLPRESNSTQRTEGDKWDNIWVLSTLTVLCVGIILMISKEPLVIWTERGRKRGEMPTHIYKAQHVDQQHDHIVPHATQQTAYQSSDR